MSSIWKKAVSLAINRRFQQEGSALEAALVLPVNHRSPLVSKDFPLSKAQTETEERHGVLSHLLRESC